MKKHFTQLTLDQVYGPKKLDVFKRFGTEAAPTDFAEIRGAESYPLKGMYFAEAGTEIDPIFLNKKFCDYWLDTKGKNDHKCFTYGKLSVEEEFVAEFTNGVRVVVPYDEIKDEIISTRTVDYGKGPVTIVTFGEYPQEELPRDFYKTYESGEVKPIGKTVGVWGITCERFYDGDEIKFEKTESPVYEYNGQKVMPTKRAVFDTLSSRSVWVRVSPVEWILDEETGLCISKDCLLGGLPMSRIGLYLNKSTVQKFLDNVFAYDIDNSLDLDMMVEDVEDYTSVDENEKSL